MSSRRRATAVLGVLAIALALATIPQAAFGASRPDKTNPDTAMISFSLPHSVGHGFTPNALNYAQAGRAGGPLLLFLPATRSVPADYREFLSTASSLGFHVLALDYWNRGESVVHTCAGIPDCYTAVQRNRLDGSHPSKFSAVTPRDSILTRLRTALRYLRTTDPGGSWARYATGSSIHWSHIVVAGHSQGGGQSAFIAHLHRVHGVLMFSSPVETDNGIAAAWMAKPGKTPASSMYGLVNSHDVYFHNVVGSWAALGMGAPVDSDLPPTQHKAHTIVNGLELGTPGQAHSRTVADSTPRDSSGVPLLEPTWAWMLRQVA